MAYHPAKAWGWSGGAERSHADKNVLKRTQFRHCSTLIMLYPFFIKGNRRSQGKGSVRMSAKAQLLELIRNLSPEQAAALIPTLEVLKSEFAKPSQPVPQKDPVQTP